MNSLYEYWKPLVGMAVSYKKRMPGLEPDTIGKLDAVHTGEGIKPDWCTIVYESNRNTLKVYAHSANLEDIQEANHDTDETTG